IGNPLLGPVRESFALKSHSIRLRRDADLYSDFGVQRMLEGCGFSKPEEKSSATGRGLRVANNAAKCDKNGILTVTYLTLMTCWRRTQSGANPSPLEFPANREKYREFRPKSASLSARRRDITPALCHLCWLTVPTAAFLTGNLQAHIRESSSLLPCLPRERLRGIPP